MADLNALLEKTSRTFALVIPFLPQPLDREVTVAYLLLRIGDTLEDAGGWSAQRKVEELNAFRSLLLAPRPSLQAFLDRMKAEPPQIAPACIELLDQTEAVLRALDDLRPQARQQVSRFVALTLEGMAEVVRRHGPGSKLELTTLEELRAYCYIVAGLVGEMLTELFLHHSPELASVAADLRKWARCFGEGLQLTNILKDESEDAAAGRRFVPRAIDRAQVFALARSDLSDATRYVLALRSAGAPRGFLEFTSLPVHLAIETLTQVEQRGSGAKVSRQRVAEIVASVHAALDAGGPLFEPRPA